MTMFVRQKYNVIHFVTMYLIITFVMLGIKKEEEMIYIFFRNNYDC